MEIFLVNRYVTEGGEPLLELDPEGQAFVMRSPNVYRDPTPLGLTPTGGYGHDGLGTAGAATAVVDDHGAPVGGEAEVYAPGPAEGGSPT